MTAARSGAHTVADALASEAARYLNVVERFAALGADPHAAARARAAERRVSPAAASKRRGVRRWRM